MYDIKKLEEEWETYNKRRKLPLYLVVVFLSLFILIIVLWFNKKNDLQQNSVIAEAKVDTTNEKKFESKQAKPPVVATENRVVLDITNKDKEDEALLSEVVGTSTLKTANRNKIDNPPYGIAQNEPVLEEVESLKSTEIPNSNKIDSQSSPKPLKIDISDILTTNAFDDVEQRFYETKDTDDSLFLARSYFKRGDYNKALYWALQTNKVNDSLEEAWLIFAESKYKMGEKEEARKVLQSYIQRSDSLKAKGLLERLK